MKPSARYLSLLAILALAACRDEDPVEQVADAQCAESNPERNLYFGDLHVHTTYSFDAYIFDVRNTPADAYRFAKGETVYLSPLDANGKTTQPVTLPQPLDFAAVTDHSEYLGEVAVCLTPDAPGYNSKICSHYRKADTTILSVFGINISLPKPTRFKQVCGDGDADCLRRASRIWRETIQAAEDADDRSAACKFTSFIAYEYTSIPGLSNMHRNVIFKNRHVPYPTSNFDQPTPEGLWRELKTTCLDAGNTCDVLVIPHNSNLSNGHMFTVESNGLSKAERRERAETRASMEPLVEIFQHKGDSECINGLSGILGATDELCNFEKIQKAPLDDCFDGLGSGGIAGIGCVSRTDYLRGALLHGLQQEAEIGVNPLPLGIIASTDTHNGTPGATEESIFKGHFGNNEDSPAGRLKPGTASNGGNFFGAGGLTAVWAEENSRASLFDAMRRKETFGTSGTRISVRFFAGWKYPQTLCDDADMLTKAYAGGVPMGGRLDKFPGGVTSPSFLVSALKDPGFKGHPGVPLQRLQIVKGWIENGQSHEAVYDVAGNANNGAGVDEATCKTTGTGYSSLCTVWRDPQYDAGQRAFYYARVVENPSCRWSTYQCNALPEAERPTTCTDGTMAKVQQERAWTSPIYYSPR